MSTAQITESDLFAMGMESETAHKLMPALCERMGFTYPPEHRQDSAKREALADPLLESQS